MYFITAGPRLLVLNSTVKDVTHSGGAVVLQVTRTAGVDPCTTLSALTAGPELPKLGWSGYFCTLLPTCDLHWQEGVL